MSKYQSNTLNKPFLDIIRDQLGMSEFLFNSERANLHKKYSHKLVLNPELIECGDYIFTYEHFKKTKCRLGGDIIHCVVDKLAAVDIDTPLDLRMANAMVKEFGLDFRL